ncbi:PQQ-binding-like beta-propeller repeat protein [Actinokineospora enzanensis]|uniref:Rv3212 family protein n=1 Tax=Actinokineospora enzanensis TaxID=155975 RepID=UPI0003A2BB76|nr:PQQ-binding-like beta-propeller repeat protein [Actinokineospora enzanensis]
MAEPRIGRRTFTRRRDWVAAAVIVVLVVGFAVVCWSGSDFRAASLQRADGTPAVPSPPAEFPPSLAETWRAESAATSRPVVTGPTVVTGNGGEVVGRDPITGDVRWRYTRPEPLCTVATYTRDTPNRGEIPGTVIAAYRTDGRLLPSSDPNSAGGCSEITGLEGATGERKYSRDSDAEIGTELLTDGSYMTTTGQRLLTTWRSDLVYSSYYGTKPAPQNYRAGLRHGCTYGSVAVDTGKIGVIERCPGETDDRITLYRAQVPDGKDPDEVDEVFSVHVGPGARVVAVTERLVAVAVPGPARLVVFGEDGQQLGQYPLPVPDEELRTDPPGRAERSYLGNDAVYWFTGGRTVALGTQDLRPLWSVDGTLGAGTVFAGRLLLPRPGELAVFDPASGATLARVPVDRGDYTGPVALSALGPIVLEQRGPTLVALR